MTEILIEGMTENKGGKESYILNSFKAFDKKKYNFTFIAYDDEIAYEDYLIRNGGRIIHLPQRSNGLFKYRKALDDLFKHNKYDVLWANKTTLSSCEILEIAKKNKVPLRIVHSHSSSNMGGKLTYILHSINKHCVRNWANEYFACSDTAGKWFYGDQPYKLIKNGIDVDKFRFNPDIREQVRKQLGLEGNFVIGHVGRLSIEKNHKKLISAFNEVKKTKADAKLVLCGDGEERSSIEEQIKQLGLTGDVILLGTVDNVNEILQAVDVIVMPSLFEGLPFALLEAQAAGLKCVVSDTISKESDIVGWNVPLPLSEKDEKWAKAICGLDISYDRADGANVIVKEGFDITECIHIVESVIDEYKGMI